MEEPLPITVPAALSIIRALSGCPGYPYYQEGEEAYAEIIRQRCVSVSHARAVLAEFESDFPTLEQLRNTILRLRDKFVPVKPKPCAACLAGWVEVERAGGRGAARCEQCGGTGFERAA